jgi:hypothetical protein
MGLIDAADNFAVRKHVEIVIAPMLQWPDGRLVAFTSGVSASPGENVGSSHVATGTIGLNFASAFGVVGLARDGEWHRNA